MSLWQDHRELQVQKEINAEQKLAPKSALVPEVIKLFDEMNREQRQSLQKLNTLIYQKLIKNYYKNTFEKIEFSKKWEELSEKQQRLFLYLGYEKELLEKLRTDSKLKLSYFYVLKIIEYYETGDEDLFRFIPRIIKFILSNNLKEVSESDRNDLAASPEDLQDSLLLLALENKSKGWKKLFSKMKLDPLCWAAENGYFDLVRFLTENGEDVNKANEDGATPLMFAAFKGDSKIAKLLIKKGANVNSGDKNGSTPLMLSAHQGRLETVQLLIENGATLNDKDKDGNTGLHLGASEGNLEVVKLLLEHGADFEVKNKDGKKAIDLAKEKGHDEIVKLLTEDEDKLRIFNKDFELRKNEYTKLVFAVVKGDPAIAKLLLENGADPNIPNRDGRPALIVAVQTRHFTIAKLFLENGADPNIPTKDDSTALMAAANSGQADIAELLIENGADINRQNKNGKTALMFAAYMEDNTMTKLLIDNGAIVNLKDNEGHIVIYYAENMGNVLPEMKEILTNKDSKTNEQNRDGNTPLHVAVIIKNKTKIKELFQRKNLNLNIRNNDGETPLDIALKAGEFEIATSLLDRGAVAYKKMDIIANRAAESKSKEDILTRLRQKFLDQYFKKAKKISKNIEAKMRQMLSHFDSVLGTKKLTLSLIENLYDNMAMLMNKKLDESYNLKFLFKLQNLACFPFCLGRICLSIL